MKLFRVLLYGVVTLFLMSSCAAWRYGSSTKVKIEGDKRIKDPVTITAKGSVSTDVYENVNLPFKLKVKHKNLPVEVSFESDNYSYQPLKIERSNDKNNAIGMFWSWNFLIGAAGAVGLGIAGIWAGPAYFLAAGGSAAWGGLTIAPAIYYVNNPHYIPSRKQFYTNSIIRKDKFENYAKTYVEDNVNVWQIKGEFEKLADWKVRVNDQTRRQKISEFYREAEQKYIEEYQPKAINYRLGKYDSENETYLVNTDLGDLLVGVPIEEARDFKNDWDAYSKTPTLKILDNKMQIAECKFTKADGKSYSYSNKEMLSYEQTDISYNFADIDLSGAGATGGNNQKISRTKLSLGQSDVDLSIPVSSKQNMNTLAVVIGNENYQREDAVPFASTDAYTFREYCIKTLGVPEKQVHFVQNATLNNMRAEINWLTNAAKALNGQANVIVYYAGHGIPDEAKGTSYLLPVDGYGSDVSTGYALSALYEKLASVETNSTTVFLDACFSGTKRSGQTLASSRGVAIKAKATTPQSSMVVFTAASGDETAYAYQEKGHGLFTYFLLKKIQETEGDVKLGELGKYIQKEVSRVAVIENNKPQTPCVIAGEKAKKWETQVLGK